jgi:hypothetical protein
VGSNLFSTSALTIISAGREPLQAALQELLILAERSPKYFVFGVVPGFDAQWLSFALRLTVCQQLLEESTATNV